MTKKFLGLALTAMLMSGAHLAAVPHADVRQAVAEEIANVFEVAKESGLTEEQTLELVEQHLKLIAHNDTGLTYKQKKAIGIVTVASLAVGGLLVYGYRSGWFSSAAKDEKPDQKKDESKKDEDLKKDEAKDPKKNGDPKIDEPKENDPLADDEDVASVEEPEEIPAGVAKEGVNVPLAKAPKIKGWEKVESPTRKQPHRTVRKG